MMTSYKLPLVRGSDSNYALNIHADVEIRLTIRFPLSNLFETERDDALQSMMSSLVLCAKLVTLTLSNPQTCLMSMALDPTGSLTCAGVIVNV
jgi:hypothetical protein